MNNNINIFAGRVFDGSGGPACIDVLIAIRNGYIERISKNGNPEIIGKKGILDLSGFTVLPGLMDCHVHLAWSGTSDAGKRRKQIDAGYPYAREIIAANIRMLRENGVTAVRDGGDHKGHALKYKNEALFRDEILMSVPGYGWHKPGRYGRLIGPEVETPSDIFKNIKTLQGVDHIKLINSGLISLKVFSEQTESQFSAPELEEIEEKANARGMHVMVHANGQKPVQNAVEAGCASVEHGFFMGPENLKRMADRGTFWVPTAVTMKAYSEYLEDPEQIRIAKMNLEHQLEQINAARRYGVMVAAGTDSGLIGVDHGKSLRDEMALLVRAGFSDAEAVGSATGLAARLLGLKDRGMIKSGMRADLIAFRSNNGSLVQGLANIEHIFIKGQPSAVL